MFIHFNHHLYIFHTPHIQNQYHPTVTFKINIIPVLRNSLLYATILQMIRLIAHITDYPSVITIFIPFICKFPHCQIFSFSVFFFLEPFCFFEGPGASFSSSDNEVILLHGVTFRPLLVWTRFFSIPTSQFSFSICSTDSLNTTLSISSDVTKFGRCLKTWCLSKGYTPLARKPDTKSLLLNLLISLGKCEGNTILGRLYIHLDSLRHVAKLSFHSILVGRKTATSRNWQK